MDRLELKVSEKGQYARIVFIDGFGTRRSVILPIKEAHRRIYDYGVRLQDAYDKDKYKRVWGGKKK